MCDDDIHQGLIEDPTVSRRTFGLMTVAAAGLTAASAHAAAPVVERQAMARDFGDETLMWGAPHRSLR